MHTINIFYALHNSCLLYLPSISSYDMIIWLCSKISWATHIRPCHGKHQLQIISKDVVMIGNNVRLVGTLPWLRVEMFHNNHLKPQVSNYFTISQILPINCINPQTKDVYYETHNYNDNSYIASLEAWKFRYRVDRIHSDHNTIRGTVF